MSETQIGEDNIVIHLEDLHALGCDCGGAYRTVQVDIHVDSSLDLRSQRIGIVHEILGAYLGVCVDPDILTEIAEQVVDSLGNLPSD